MLIVFLDYQGVVNHQYALEGQNINQQYYQEILCCLCGAVHHKQLDLWKVKNWQLHHNNDPVHSTHIFQTFLDKHDTPLVYRAPCYYWLCSGHTERDTI